VAIHNVTCERCGVSFRAVRRDADPVPKFCSQKCRRTRIDSTCAQCGASISVKRIDFKESGNFCSKACAYESRRTIEDATCEQCGVVFRPLAASEGRFCSNACYTNFRLSLPTDERAKLMASATAKIRGSKRSLHDLSKRARTKQDIAKLSGDEAEIMAALNNAGLYPVPLFALGKYNIDFAFPDQMVAVEYNGGNWHNTPIKRAADEIKSEFLRAEGWKLLTFARLDKPQVNNAGNRRIAISDIVLLVAQSVHN